MNVVPHRALAEFHLPPRGDLVLIGGEDHRTGQEDHPEGRYERLLEWARARFLGIGPFIVRWSGQILESLDGLGLIGEDPEGQENVWIVSGDSGNGLTHGTIAGMLISDLIAGRTNPWTELYSPKRKPLGAVGELAVDNAVMAAQYADWLKGSEVDSEESVRPGSGAVIRKGLKTWIAVHRREDGQVIRHSAVCPHLGCIVHWNSAEGSWDCPCHGSRFTAEGEVLNGPALAPLADVEGMPEEAADGSAAHGRDW